MFAYVGMWGGMVGVQFNAEFSDILYFVRNERVSGTKRAYLCLTFDSEQAFLPPPQTIIDSRYCVINPVLRAINPMRTIFVVNESSRHRNQMRTVNFLTDKRIVGKNNLLRDLLK